MQHRLLFIEQNPIDSREIYVSSANLNSRQATAATEGLIPDAPNAIRNRDARQAFAAPEGPNPDASDAIRNRDARKAGAVIEGIIGDARDAIRYSDARQAGAVFEGVTPDAGDRVAFNGVRNDQLAGGGSITISDSDFSVIRGVSQVIQTGSVERQEC